MKVDWQLVGLSPAGTIVRYGTKTYRVKGEHVFTMVRHWNHRHERLSRMVERKIRPGVVSMAARHAARVLTEGKK